MSLDCDRRICLIAQSLLACKTFSFRLSNLIAAFKVFEGKQGKGGNLVRGDESESLF